jgi:hypothetical protein
VNSLARRRQVRGWKRAACSIVSFSARWSAANNDGDAPIPSILVHFFIFFAEVRAGVRLLSDPVTARKFFSLDWSDPVMEVVS